MKKLSLSIVTLAAFGVAGCANHNNNNKTPTASAKPPVDTKFETMQDPPIKAKTHFAAGQLAESQGKFSKAVEQYWEAVRLEPKYKDPLFRLGVVYCQLKHYPDAIVAWKQYLKATDGDPTGYSNLGFSYELSGQHDEAEKAYRHGIERDPKNSPCRVNYGLMLARDNRTAEAIIQLQAVLTQAEVHYNLASVYEFQGRKEQARSEYRKALNLDPNLADAEVRLSILR
jgi:tetratricopeptide (TPR) repeat protein